VKHQIDCIRKTKLKIYFTIISNDEEKKDAKTDKDATKNFRVQWNRKNRRTQI